MGYPNRSTRAQARLFFDIETVAMPGVEDLIPEPRVPANIKDPGKVAEHLAEARAEAVSKAALDPDLSTVRLISMRVGRGESHVVLVPAKKLPAARVRELSLYVPEGARLTVCDEATAVRTFWEAFSLCSGNCVGFNVLGFDLPFLMRRSMELRVPLGYSPNLAKYRSEPVTDLAALLSNWSWTGGKRLKWLATRYGLEVLAPEVDGSDVADMTYGELITYGLSDLHVTAQLYDLMNGVYFNHVVPA